jgi:hypothetical protein
VAVGRAVGRSHHRPNIDQRVGRFKVGTAAADFGGHRDQDCSGLGGRHRCRWGGIDRGDSGRRGVRFDNRGDRRRCDNRLSNRRDRLSNRDNRRRNRLSNRDNRRRNRCDRLCLRDNRRRNRCDRLCHRDNRRRNRCDRLCHRDNRRSNRCDRLCHRDNRRRNRCDRLSNRDNRRRNRRDRLSNRDNRRSNRCDRLSNRDNRRSNCGGGGLFDEAQVAEAAKARQWIDQARGWPRLALPLMRLDAAQEQAAKAGRHRLAVDLV